MSVSQGPNSSVNPRLILQHQSKARKSITKTGLILYQQRNKKINKKWWPTIQTFVYVRIINKWFDDNYNYTVPCTCIKQKYQLLGSLNNCSCLYVASSLILVVQGATMFCGLDISVKFWLPLMSGCPLHCNFKLWI